MIAYKFVKFKRLNLKDLIRLKNVIKADKALINNWAFRFIAIRLFKSTHPVKEWVYV